MSNLQKVLVRKQNEDFQVVETKTLNLEYLQSQVGGFIELVNWFEDLNNLGIDMWINEEGKLIENLKTTFIVVDNNGEVVDAIFGDVVFTSTDMEGNTIGLNDIQIQKIKKILGQQVGVTSNGSIAHIIKM